MKRRVLFRTTPARHDTAGVHSLSRLDDDGLVRVLVTEQHLGRTNEPTLRDLSEALIAVYGTDYGIHNPIWVSRFTDMSRQGGVLPPATGCCLPATLHTCITQRVDRPQHRYAGCGKSRVKAGPGGQRNIAGRPSRYLPC